ncbi:MAG TPA: carbohydrate kinase, partial [Armatimonadetes bacterium]|nr:carbohydrate kinase [Armatimonadota bacterium]
MTRERLRRLLDNFPNIKLVVVGDFFLDKYLVIDRRLSEVSLETGLEAYQVVEKRPSPGAAGTVTNNLKALGVGTVYAVGVVGDDGEGYELLKGLKRTGVVTDHLILREDLFTPTYTKPMMREPDGRERELNRLDIKNRKPLPKEVEGEIVGRLRALIPEVHGVIVADQVQERNYGVITGRVRGELARLAEQYPGKVFYADSKERIGEFRNLMIKPN